MVLLSEDIEGSSSSSTNNYKYDVFLSFRGVDTRHGFTNHLHKALLDATISTFLDDEEIETGGELKPELEGAIKESRVSIVVLSKNYPTSTWCLDELVLILDQLRKSKQIVIPIFYHVEPTHVRKQEDTYGDAMSVHQQKMEMETNANRKRHLAQKIKRWKKALKEVADLKGEDVKDRPEIEFIEKIVKDIYRRLHIYSRIPLPQLFGTDDSIEFVTSWLKDASSDTGDILTISGMGGIGKTSLAKHVYLSHSHEFNTSNFIGDISRRCEVFNGLLDLQKQLYDGILKPSSIQVHDVSLYTSMIENAVNRKKVFLVLDDIDSLDQLNALIGRKRFHAGSKIIITTKSRWLTESCALFKTNVKPKHRELLLNGLCKAESRQLLCFHAFMSKYPKEGYEELIEKLVEYCSGHPLALKLLGESLHNRDVAYWEGLIETLKKENGSPVNSIFRISFDSLPSENDKDLFKHIACFFVGTDRDVTEAILKACNISTRVAFTNLIDRCLLSVEENNTLMMHQLLQEMGRFIVREESPNKPWERSRLWCHEESFEVLKRKKGMENVLGLTLDMRMLEKDKLRGSFELKTDSMSNMDNLMLLQLNYVQMKGSCKNFPEQLRWLCMHGFPLDSIPSNLPMDNLVSLDMSYSKIKSFDIGYSYRQRVTHMWQKKLIGSCSKNKSLLGSLKFLNLSFCDRITKLGGFDRLPSLESLKARNCIGLVEVCESIEACVELVLIDLRYCKQLAKLPRTMGMLKKVKTLLLDGCNHNESQMLNSNTKTSSSIGPEVIPSALEFFEISLPTSLVRLSLANNNLSTKSFPMDLSRLSVLKELDLDGNPIISMPICVRTLPRIEKLSMSSCSTLTSVEHPPPTLRELVLTSNLLQKVVFDPEMGPLDLRIPMKSSALSYEIEGVIKVQPMEVVDEKVLKKLGWSKLFFRNKKGTRREESQIQMYYEFGIFSTIYRGEDIPNWVTHRSKGPSISFTIPSSPNNLIGLNFCSVHAFPSLNKFFQFQVIEIKNITKNRTWFYRHCTGGVGVSEECLILLSHWMFGRNDMEAGDHVTITLLERHAYVTKKCGVGFVYDDGNTEEEDVLDYYKSWNLIIGGDLSGFQLTTGEYTLDKRRMVAPFFRPLCFDIGNFADYTDEVVPFRALSKRKSDIQLGEK